MCPASGSVEEAAEDLSGCARWANWMAQADAGQERSVTPLEQSVRAIAQDLSRAERPLIWVDGADVGTMRGAVRLAQKAGATIHVGQTTGAEVVKKVMLSEGWLGTSLAEVSEHADLVVTLGDGILTEAPRLAERFLEPVLQRDESSWWHIAECSSGSGPREAEPAISRQIVWPRKQWYSHLTELLLRLQQPAGDSLIASVSGDLQALRDKLKTASYTVWIWDSGEWHDAMDELIVRRLLAIARHLTKEARCSLLCLESSVGRVTAEETLLWITGCSTTAIHNGSHWISPERYHAFTLDDWQKEFDSILLVRSIASITPLPFLRTRQAIIPAGQSHAGLESSCVTRVAEVGRQHTGHLFRGDRAATLPSGGIAGGELPTAEKMLARVYEQLPAPENDNHAV